MQDLTSHDPTRQEPLYTRAVERFRAMADELDNHPELAQELRGLADAIEQANRPAPEQDLGKGEPAR